MKTIRRIRAKARRKWTQQEVTVRTTGHINMWDGKTLGRSFVKDDINPWA